MDKVLDTRGLETCLACLPQEDAPIAIFFWADLPGILREIG
jgi:hypothetical protein